MKTIIIVALLAAFLAGAYELGRHQTNNLLINRVDSLKRCLNKNKSKDSLLSRQIDSLKSEPAKLKRSMKKNSPAKI